ncbi:MAG: 50S ribosomal protein L13 [Patescibacteria group bacterium]
MLNCLIVKLSVSNITIQQYNNSKNMVYTLDATNKKLGRLASEIAIILQGKNNPSYNPRLPGEDEVVIKNGSKVEVSGNKATQKIYYHHTGYIGHLKEEAFEKLFARAPDKVIWKAVYNMLPKNRLRKERMKHLIIKP